VSEQALISIIDDDESLCAAVTGLLRSYGYEARSFTSAEAFLASDALADCRCIITDVHMPGMSGIELKQALVARQNGVPVIMITARNDPGVESRALASGAVCLLKKPFEANVLMECVSQALRG
jgi:FixJ family two-component response regulator